MIKNIIVSVNIRENLIEKSISMSASKFHKKE